MGIICNGYYLYCIMGKTPFEVYFQSLFMSALRELMGNEKRDCLLC